MLSHLIVRPGTFQEHIAKYILRNTHSIYCSLEPGPQTSIMNVFCQLLDPDRGEDATRGHWQLSKYLERFAFTYLLQYTCDTCCTQKYNL